MYYITAPYGTTGLSVTIDIIDLSNDSVVVNDAAMSEIGTRGVYKYNFSSYDEDKNYLYITDAGAAMGDDQYQYSTNNKNLDKIKATIDAYLDMAISTINGQIVTLISDVNDIEITLTSIETTVNTYLDQKISQTGLGNGNTSVTYTVVDQDSNPLSGVEVDVRATNDITADVVASGVTNDAGEVTFYLDSGVTYYLWRKKSGYNFTEPDTEDVP